MIDAIAMIQLTLIILLAIGVLILLLRKQSTMSDGLGLLPEAVTALKIELERLDKRFEASDSAARDSADSRAALLRTEVTTNLSEARTETRSLLAGLQQQVVQSIDTFGTGVKGQIQTGTELQQKSFEAFAATLTTLTETLEGKFNTLRQEMTNAGNSQREETTNTLKLMGNAQKEALDAFSGAFKSLTEALENTIGVLRQNLNDTGEQQRNEMKSALELFGGTQKTSLDAMLEQLRGLSATNADGLKAVGETLEKSLNTLRAENTEKLDRMRETVDEKLKDTLDKRLTESFGLVTKHLQDVYQSLGEMQKLSAGIGNLERAFSNVKTRGAWGEVQLGSILEDMLAPDQFRRNVKVSPEDSSVVEYCVVQPKVSADEQEVLLPIDAKFPIEDFIRLNEAAENGNIEQLEAARRQLERRFRQNAKDIATKYIRPPHTTDYAVMFVPSEGIYAEGAKIPGLLTSIVAEHRVMIAGPSNLMAMLVALKASYRSVAIQRQAGDISKVLAKVQSEFVKYTEAISTVKKRAESTVGAITDLEKRQRQMGKAFAGIEAMRGLPTDGNVQVILEAMAEDNTPSANNGTAEASNNI
jgi:DNA recombination protein RmuC